MKSILILLAISTGLFAKTARLDGKDVYYETSGKGAKTVVMIHGWTCDHTFWSAQVPAFSRQYKVIALDLPGHGRSAGAEAYPVTLFARAVEAVMSEEKTGKAILMGHSMGGAVILTFARLFPSKLTGAVLVDSFMRDAAAAAMPVNFHERFAGEAGKEARRKMVEGMFSAATAPEAREHILKGMLGAPESTAMGAMKGMFEPEVWREGQSQAPALAVVANPKQITEAAVRARFPNLTYRDMPGTGHFLMMEKPAEFNALVLEWIGKQ
ncbi:MAG: alpha/beta hydrolase [Bryobacter sp.]|nr:alpha/beta hydrolase [Bryobacter sp.]